MKLIDSEAFDRKMMSLQQQEASLEIKAALQMVHMMLEQTEPVLNEAVWMEKATLEKGIAGSLIQNGIVYECSKCGHIVTDKTKFCSECGAYMGE